MLGCGNRLRKRHSGPSQRLQAQRQLPDQFRQGDFSALLSWLREKLHRHGAKFEPQELVQRITGSKIDPAPYVRYLQTKYGQIYAL